MTAALAEGRTVTGVDISATQIEAARRNVPGATFVQADMTTLDFEPRELRRRRGVLLPDPRPARRAGGAARTDPALAPARWPVPRLDGRRRRTGRRRGGLARASTCTSATSGAKANRRLVEKAGLRHRQAEVAVEPEDRHDARFLWVVARAPVGGLTMRLNDRGAGCRRRRRSRRRRSSAAPVRYSTPSSHRRSSSGRRSSASPWSSLCGSSAAPSRPSPAAGPATVRSATWPR